MKLFLDDTRNPYDVFMNTVDFDYYENQGWTIVRSHDEFVKFITDKGVPSLISFDHDLEFSHYLTENQYNIDYDKMSVKTGYHSAKWLIEYCNVRGIDLPKTKVHSQNPEGKKNIESLFV